MEHNRRIKHHVTLSFTELLKAFNSTFDMAANADTVITVNCDPEVGFTRDDTVTFEFETELKGIQLQ